VGKQAQKSTEKLILFDDHWKMEKKFNRVHRE